MAWKAIKLIICVLAALFFFQVAYSSEDTAISSCTMSFKINGPIMSPALRYLKKGIEKNKKEDRCSALMLEINTPGGDLSVTRKIVEVIMGSEIPILCLVSPAGGQAGSAGAIILQACHVSGAILATHIGAATPVLSTGEDMSEDMRRKVINDTVSWLESLTQFRGRNQQFGRDIVKSAKSISAKEAARIGAIDVLVERIEDFLNFANGREVKLSQGRTTKVQTGGRTVDFTPPDIVANPEYTYLLFMGSLALLYFEFTNPGLIIPGVLGVVGLLFSLANFYMLDINWGGLALMLLGIGLIVTEVFLPFFGLLGLGGIGLIIFGGTLLYDIEVTGYEIPLEMLVPTAILLGLLVVIIGKLAVKAQRRRKKTGKADLYDVVVEVESVTKGNAGTLQVFGEIWKFESNVKVKIGDRVKIKDVQGLKLVVEKV